MVILNASPQNALLFISRTEHLESQLKRSNSSKLVIEFLRAVFFAYIRYAARQEC